MIALLLILYISQSYCIRLQDTRDESLEHIHPMQSFAARAPHIAFAQNEGVITIKGSDELLQSPQSVMIEWSGLSHAASSDLIALYAPADADPTQVAPVQLINADAASGGTHSKSGSGSAIFSVLNHRSPTLRFMLLSFPPESPDRSKVLAVSPSMFNRITDLPSYGHLTIGEDPSSVVVQWISGSNLSQGVEYRLAGESQEETFTAASSVVSYAKEELCGPPANSFGYIHPGFIHSATLTMNPTWSNSLVLYRYGSDAVGWSEESSFKFLPPPSAEKALVFLAFNDVSQALNPTLFENPPCPLGCRRMPWLPWCPPYCGGIEFTSSFGANSKKLTSMLEKEDSAHLALMIGDLSYAMGYVADWDSFGQQFEEAFRRLPLAIGMGNHERDWPGTGDAFNELSHDSGGECGVAVGRRFHTPGHRSYYSFEAGPVHFLIIDSEILTDQASPQGQFISKDLQSVDKTVTPWVVVGLHRMVYAPASDRRSLVGDLVVEERLQRDLEDLFLGSVDLVIQGHQHAYARTCKVYKGNCYESQEGAGRSQGIKAPVYVLAGNAGASFSHGHPKILPKWTKKALEDQNGFLRVTTTIGSLLLEAVSSDDGSVFDSLTLKKDE
jgi:hypothetical protein